MLARGRWFESSQPRFKYKLRNIMTHFSEEQRDICIEVLSIISKNPQLIDHDNVMKGLISKVYKNGKKRRYKQEHFAVVELGKHSCYICKRRYKHKHHFYELLCLECAQFNMYKRNQRASLHEHIAIVTGGRIKIGYVTALKMLRDGARVIVTTRFPINAAKKYAQEQDFEEWRKRLHIYPLDLMSIPAVKEFCLHIAHTYPYVSILINNAAQTIQRPPAYYRELKAIENTPVQNLLPQIASTLVSINTKLLSAEQVSLEENSLFPLGKTNQDGEPLDLRNKNSWVLRLHEVSLNELLETQLVNCIAPFILIQHLKNALQQSPLARKFIVNVSAMEGQFSRETKTINHPHTNMAKAALNMITRTSAQDFAEDRIYMNSVDTGWVTDENPLPKQCPRFIVPLDIVDGAARVYDAVVSNLNISNEPLYGRFFKDYKSVTW